MTAMTKAELRRHLRKLRGHSAGRAEESEAICRHILASRIYQEANVIGGYIPLAHEADIMPVLADALACGKTLALPLCGDAPSMTMRKVEAISELKPGAYGIPAPSVDAPLVPAAAIQLLLVPLEGIDTDGYRLGKGGGYYDCLLADADVMTLGCALSWQLLGHLPRDPWDRPLAAAATMEGITYFRSNIISERTVLHASEEED